MQAVAVYLRTLRGLEGISQKAAGKRIKMSDKSVIRWESGGVEPPMTTLKKYVIALRGSVIRAMMLLFDVSDDVEAAERAARNDWKKTTADDEELILLGHLADLRGEQRQLAIDMLRQLQVAQGRGE
jgi:transcriptional regulator with XRE-family HTH domain